jgi:hypothetical protein
MTLNPRQFDGFEPGDSFCKECGKPVGELTGESQEWHDRRAHPSISITSVRNERTRDDLTSENLKTEDEALRPVNLNNKDELITHLRSKAHDMWGIDSDTHIGSLAAPHLVHYATDTSGKGWGTPSSARRWMLSESAPSFLKKANIHPDVLDHIGNNHGTGAFNGYAASSAAHPFDRLLDIKDLQNIHDWHHNEVGYSNLTNIKDNYTTVGNRHFHHKVDLEDL